MSIPPPTQPGQNAQQSATMNPSAALDFGTQWFNARRRQQGYQGPDLPNRQPMQQRHSYVNTHSNLALPNPNHMLNPRNYQSHRTPAQQPNHPNSNTQNHDQDSQYSRPFPRNRQLYVPGVQPQSQHQIHNQSNWQTSGASMRSQAKFLDQLAGVEIPKAAISLDELQEKETLRLVLEEVCRNAVTEHERKKDSAFDEYSVVLSCFGSLASGFATHSADMDLALVSPLSKPEASSSESEIPRLLEKALLDLGYGARLLTRTRVPIIKFCEKPTPDLVAKLLEERIKYEKERDAPPKPPKDKKAQEKKSGDTKRATKEKVKLTDGVMEDPARTTQTLQVEHQLLQPPVDEPESTNHAKSILEEYTATKTDADQGYTELSTPVINNVDDFKIDGFKYNHAPQIEDSALNVLAQDVVQAGDQKPLQVTKTDSVAATKPEKTTDLSLFSDGELVRLYDLAIKEGWYEPSERATITTFKQAVARYGPDSFDPDLRSARSNLETLTDVLKKYRAPPEHHLDFPKTGVGIQCDINFSNQLALHNTHLLKCYGVCDPRVRPMVLFVKAWAKRRKINSPYHGTLSSYGYVLMVLHYLVNIVQPTIAPNLQTTRKAMQDKSAENDIMIDGYNVRFWRTESEIVDLAKRGMLTHNREDTIGSLLRGFFQYYAQPHIGFSWSTDVLSLRTEGGILSKAQKGWTGAKTVISESKIPGEYQKEIRHRYLFAIEDPFEVDHNIARTVVHNGIVAIRDEFRRAHRIIQSAGHGDWKAVEDLFAEGESKDNLQYRAFGPLPRKDNDPVNKEAKAADGLSVEKGREVASVNKNGKKVDGAAGKIGDSRVVPKSQMSAAKPDVGPGSTRDGSVSIAPKTKDSKAQPPMNVSEGQVKSGGKHPPLEPSTASGLGKDKAGSTQKNVDSTRSTGASSRNVGTKTKKKAVTAPNKQATSHGPGKERDVGAVYKNGKEVAGSSGRVGEAGVIPRKPS